MSMAVVKVAHIKIQGVPFVLVPLSPNAAKLSAEEFGAIHQQLMQFCRSANLGGEVIPIWNTSGGLRFRSDPRFHGVLNPIMKAPTIEKNLNKEFDANSLSPALNTLLTGASLTAVLREEIDAAEARAQAAKPPASAPPPSGGADGRSMPGFSSGGTRYPNRVVTMVFTDLVHSTKLKQKFGDAYAMELVTKHHALVRRLIRGTSTGEEVSTQGDAFFVAFATPSDAVIFALSLQRYLRDTSETDGERLYDRIGIHTGEVVAERVARPDKQFDLNGIQVDTAARIQSLATGDQILMSRFVYDNAKQMLEGQEIPGLDEISWKRYGYYEMKGVAEPIEICEVGENGYAILKPPADSEKAKRVRSA
jgi:class 3 adenylate cyclase